MEADGLSRRTIGEYSWRLSERAFGSLEPHTPFTVDAFATAETTQLQRYWSRFPEMSAAATDALDQDWGREGHVYAFPPPLLIPQVLHKAQAERATVTLVTPQWETQPWWGLLMAARVPYWILRTHPQPLTEPRFDSSSIAVH